MDVGLCTTEGLEVERIEGADVRGVEVIGVTLAEMTGAEAVGSEATIIEAIGAVGNVAPAVVCQQSAQVIVRVKHSGDWQ